MRTVLGVSVGSTTARAAALEAADESVRSTGMVRVSDNAGQVAAAVELLESMADAQHVEPADCLVAVPDDPTGRLATSAYSVHDANRFRVVSELGAQLRFLRGTGQLDGLGTVAVCDIGASGTTVSIAEPDTGRVLVSERTAAFGAKVCDVAVRDYLLSTYGADELVSDDGDEDLMAAIGHAREQLSSLRVAEVEGPFVTGAVRLWRSTFDDVVEAAVRQIEWWAARVIVDAPHAVNALVMVGGCAHLPMLRRVFRRDLRLPVLVSAMPESLTAHGAALLASDSARRRSPRPLVSVKSHQSSPAAYAAPAYDAVPRHHRTA